MLKRFYFYRIKNVAKIQKINENQVVLTHFCIKYILWAIKFMGYAQYIAQYPFKERVIR